jgi:glycosyltransferase involved in cell wall biosynthesis
MLGEASLPSFSIVVETENLATADLAELLAAIDCLAQQDPPPSQANEVLIIDSGDIPDTVKQQLSQRYPWLILCPAPPEMTYYAAKMLGADRCSGEIVVYYDSDCLYEPHWLRTMLNSFQDTSVQVVAGETRTRGIGVYGTAMALAYIFPQYSGHNVAFRRLFLLAHPIPSKLPLYRGNCVIHAKQLTRLGVTIWRQPKARATHAPPNGLSHFIWRFLLIGYDYHWQKRVLEDLSLPVQSIGQEAEDPTASGIAGKLKVLDDRVGKLIRSNPWHLFFIPFSIPIIFVAVSLILLGRLITQRHPHYLLEKFDRLYL